MHLQGICKKSNFTAKLRLARQQKDDEFVEISEISEEINQWNRKIYCFFQNFNDLFFL